MRYNELKQITKHLQKYKTLSKIQRVADTLFLIEFDKKNFYYFLMQKANTLIYKEKDVQIFKNFNAPFDISLKKLANGSEIQNIELEDGNKIIRFFLSNKKSYKALPSVLQFEFTNKNPNVILLDDKDIVIAALRHIDLQNSYRQVVPNKPLLPLHKMEFKADDIEIKDIEEYLFTLGEQKKLNLVENLKSTKVKAIQKKIENLEKIYNSLEGEATLSEKSTLLYTQANLILSNLHLLKSYQKELKMTDFEGNEVKLLLPEHINTPKEFASFLFTNAKKLKQKAINGKIERENISQKLLFLKRLQKSINEATNSHEIELLYPSTKQVRKQKQEKRAYESFEMNGYTIYVGKSAKSNVELLKDAKASDIWLHLKDIPSSHVIIKTNKKSVPDEVLYFAAKLCVNFSVEDTKGSYLVDYTQRRNVKMREDSNVNYVEYSTLNI